MKGSAVPSQKGLNIKNRSPKRLVEKKNLGILNPRQKQKGNRILRSALLSLPQFLCYVPKEVPSYNFISFTTLGNILKV